MCVPVLCLHRGTLQIGTPTAYAGLTLAGVLATSSHGSGDKTISAMWDTLLEIVWVDGKGKVHTSKPSDPEFIGMVGGMGTFGVMTE
jgi:FAD/FMN-containing dehydrogenase